MSKAKPAGEMADLGRVTGAFKVFRCKPDIVAWDHKAGENRPVGKEPLWGERWTQTASWDRKTVEAMWIDHPDSNIGLAIQPGFVVVDADLYKAGADAALAKFEAEHGKLPDTMEFASASGGRHLIYSTAKLLGNGEGSLPDFGDVRGHGGYIVGPGSTFNGKPYTVVDADPPIPLPEHVASRLVEKRTAAAGDKVLPANKMLNDPTNIALFTAWLRTEARVSISNAGGNNTLAETGAMGHSYGLSREEALHLMAEHWNDRCLPPWDPEDLEKFGGSGYRSATSAFGNKARVNPALDIAMMGFKDVTKAAVERASRDGMWRTMADIAGTTPPDRQWLAGTDADGWVPLGGITLLYGAGGAGKTLLMGQWALAQARGEPLFGIPLRKMPVLLVAAEDDTDEMHRRFAKQGMRASDDVTFASVRGEDTSMHPPLKQSSTEDTWLFSQIDHKMAIMPAGPKLLILDNLAQIYQGNYFEQAEISKFLNLYLGRLSKLHEATIIVLAHPSESQQTSGGGGYGGVAWSNGVRARLYLERHMTKPVTKRGAPTIPGKMVGRERVLSRKKANYADDAAPGLVLDWVDWVFKPVAKVDKVAEAFQAEARVKEETAADAAMLLIVQTAAEFVMSTNPTLEFSHRRLAEAASHKLEMPKLTAETIRKTYLLKMVARSHPAFRVEKGLWRHYNLN